MGKSDWVCKALFVMITTNEMTENIREKIQESEQIWLRKSV